MPRRFHGRFTHRRRLRRHLAVLSLMLVGLLAGGYWYMSRPDRVGRIAGDLLAALSSADVSIAEARLNWDGVIELSDVTLRVPEVQEQAAQLFHAEQILMKVDLWEAMRGRFVAQQMILIDPTLTPTQVGPTFNYEVLQERRQRQAKQGPVKLPEQLPRVIVRGGRIMHGEVYDGAYQQIGSIELDGMLKPLLDRHGLYDFELTQRMDEPPTPGAPPGPDAPPGTPLSMSGQFDLQDLSVRWTLSDFAFADPHRNMLPKQIRDWWDMFEPSGSLPEVAFSYDEKTGPKGLVRVQNVAMTLPSEWMVEKVGEGPEQTPPATPAPPYEPRMSHVSGTFRFDADGVSIETLVGEIEGLVYRIDGRIDGYTRDARFRMKLETLAFQIPEEPRYMLALPVKVQKVFKTLNPVGWMRVSMELKRETIGGELDYNGKATILSGRELIAELRKAGRIDGAVDPNDERWISRGAYHKFPYELSNCHGLLTFNRDAIEVKNLTGETGNGGSATIVGQIGPPEAGGDAAVDLTVTAVNIALYDDKLRNALPERQQAALDLFFDRPAWTKLLERGYFVHADRRQADIEYRTNLSARIETLRRDPATNADELARLHDEAGRVDTLLAEPVFELGGRGNIVVRVERPMGKGLKPQLHTSIDLQRANVVFRFFPYPVRVTGGRLVISPGRTTFEQIVLEGLHGGRGGLVGYVDVPPKDSGEPIAPHVHLIALDVPFDELLYDIIPTPQDRWLRDLHLAGRFDAEGDIELADTGKVGVDMKLKLADASATPGGGAFTIEQIAGEVGVRLGRMELRGVTGKRGDATFELGGEADWSDRDRPSMRFHAVAHALRFEDPVLDLIGPVLAKDSAARRFWTERMPEGAFDADATYSIVGDKRDWAVAIAPESLSFMHRGSRIGLINTEGTMTLTPGAVAIDGIGGEFDGGRIKMSGTVALEPQVRAELSLKASGDRITPAARQALPLIVTKVIDGLSLVGAYDADVTRLVMRPGATEGQSFAIAAKMKLTDAAATVGLPLTKMTAQVDVKASSSIGDAWPRLDVTVHATELLAAGRPISDLVLDVRNTEPTDRLIVPRLEGRASGGRLTGTGVLSAADGKFQLQVALADAKLALMIEPEAPGAAPPADAPPGPTGTLSASIAIEGNLNDRAALRGRGDLLVRDGDLYGVPLAIGLLRISHLTLPVKDHFDSASISYYLQNRSVDLQRLQLKSRTMLLDGGGKLDLESGEVDIAMTTSNPAGLDLGPLTELINKVRDQLVTVRITGTLADPKTRIQQFSGLSRAVNDVFGGEQIHINE